MWQARWQKLLAQAEKDKAQAEQVKKSLDIHIGNKVLSKKHLQLKDKPGKLRPIFVMPFISSQEIKNNAMKLDLLASMAIHPVFNVSLLEKYYGD